jgi:hypothetical protein
MSFMPIAATITELFEQHVTTPFPLLLPYGLKCVISHIVLYVTFKYLLPSATTTTTTSRQSSKDDYNYPWKLSPSFTANRIVAFCVMSHWSYLGFKHVWSYDYNNEEGAAKIFIPAGFEIAQIAMGTLLCWDIPSSLIGGSGPSDVMMHIHHIGMVLVTACVLGVIGTSDSISNNNIVGTHVAPIFLGAIEFSSIPLQIVDLCHPKKSPHWYKYVNNNMSPSSTTSMSFQKLCSSVNEISRILFAFLFLITRGFYFPYVVVTIAIPDFNAEGSLPSMVLLYMSILFSLLQMYWATLVVGQVKGAFFPSGGKGKKGTTKSKDE